MAHECLCLITRVPHDIWMGFLSNFRTLSIYIVIDDNSISCDELKQKYPALHFIQIANEECEANGFVDVNYIGIHKKISGWDKALFYFSKKYTHEYTNVWFIEDDVFFLNEGTLLNLNNRFPETDLISQHIQTNEHGDKGWHWSEFTVQLPLPHYSGLMCASRLSKSLLAKIAMYASQHNTLFFLEALFPTLCMFHKLTVSTPSELDTIEFMKKGGWKTEHMVKPNVYHPIKNIHKQFNYRNQLHRRKW